VRWCGGHPDAGPCRLDPKAMKPPDALPTALLLGRFQFTWSVPLE
jgi:hypothetical protein